MTDLNQAALAAAKEVRGVASTECIIHAYLDALPAAPLPEEVERAVAELRSNSTLAVCPYDRRSPDYLTAPNDRPCPMCGGEPEGPDKCTGADLRVMSRAADLLTQQAQALADANARITAMEEALEKINRRASPNAERTFDHAIRDLEWITAEARRARGGNNAE